MEKIDVPALLRKIARVGDLPEGHVLRHGAWLVDRWWRLRVCVDPQYRYCGRGRWLPGIALWGCDPRGRFGQFEFFLFDEVTAEQIDVPRVEAFLKMFVASRKAAEEKRAARRRTRRRKATVANGPETKGSPADG
jgi:hypothetical protein